MMNVTDLETVLMNDTKKPTVAPLLILTATRDGIHYQLMNMVRFNRYDMKFMANIMEKYIAPKKPLSPGQNALYEKIVHKYRKQLRKLNVNYKDIIALGWDQGIVPTELLNQKTYFRIVEDEIQLYFNFNKTHISNVRAIVHDDKCNHLNCGLQSNFGNGQKYNFTWHNPTKSWSGPFNVYLFKQLYKFAKGIRVQIESTAENLISELDAKGTLAEWTPSVKIIFGRMYVSHIAETMLPILETIDPTDLSILNIERMCKLGLKAPARCELIAEYVESVSLTAEHVIQTADDVSTLRNYLEQTKRKVVFYMPEIGANSDKLKAIQNLKGCETWGDGNHSAISEPPVPLPWTLSSSTPMSMNSPDKLDKILEEGYNTLVTTAPLTSLIRSQSQVGKFAIAADKVIYLKLKETT